MESSKGRGRSIIMNAVRLYETNSSWHC